MKKIVQGMLFFLSSVAWAEQPSASAVASSHPLATQAGITILEQGGNAFDAAIAVGAVLAVVEPYQSGIGGGGFFLLHDEKSHSDIVIDARERAPLLASQTMKLEERGALSAAIPGTPAGFAYLAKHYGHLSLERSLAPAIELAEKGFPIDDAFVEAIKEAQPYLSQYPASAKLFLPEGKLPHKGFLLKQPNLAYVLKKLAKEEHAGFYEGEVANALVEGVRELGGLWQRADLSQYQVSLQEPLFGEYHDMKVITVGLPSAGGIALLEALNILAEYELTPLSEADRYHLIVETLRRVNCDKQRYLGDPEFTKTDAKRLLSENHAEEWRKTIKMDQATPSASLDCGSSVSESSHTTHYSILDQEGNRVAATLTVNGFFGSGLVISGTGVLLNNEMWDFSTEKGKPNSIAARKRPLSNITPTFFINDEGIGILGSPGGIKIPSIVLLGILAAEKNNNPEYWDEHPRFYQPLSPDKIHFEQKAFSVPMQNALALRGHKLEEVKPYGDMQSIFWDKDDNRVMAASDRRGNGLATVKALPKKPKDKMESLEDVSKEVIHIPF